MPRRDACIVAINDYGGDGRNNLNSCIADAFEMERLLRGQYGFQGITKLLDGEATIANVDRALTALLTDVKPDDRLVFFYSGHGYQLQKGPNREEVLCLRDGFYEDDRLSAKTQGLPLGVLTVVLDSCFSGGMEKVLVPGMHGFDLALSKVWKPTAEQVRQENEQLQQANQIFFKSFGSARAQTSLAVPKEFALVPPEGPTVSLESFLPALEAAGVFVTKKAFGPASAVQPDVTKAFMPTPAGTPRTGETAGTATTGPGMGTTGAGVGTGPSGTGATASGIGTSPSGTGKAPSATETGPVFGQPGAPKDVGVMPPRPDEAGQLQMRAVLISAALENETASAKSDRTDGLSAFTYGLREALKAGGFELSPAEFVPRVTTGLRSLGFRQTPLLKEPPAPERLGQRSFITFAPRIGLGPQAPIALDSLIAAIRGGTNMVMHPSAIDPNTILQILTQSGLGKGPASPFGPGFAGQPTIPMGVTAEEQQKWILPLLAAVPSIVGMFTKGLGQVPGFAPQGFPGFVPQPGMSPEAAKGWLDALGVAAGGLPRFFGALGKEYIPQQPGVSPEVLKGWMDALGVVAGGIPSFIGALGKGYTPYATQTPEKGIVDALGVAFAGLPGFIGTLGKGYSPYGMTQEEKNWRDALNVVVGGLPTFIGALGKSAQPMFGAQPTFGLQPSFGQPQMSPEQTKDWLHGLSEGLRSGSRVIEAWRR